VGLNLGRVEQDTQDLRIVAWPAARNKSRKLATPLTRLPKKLNVAAPMTLPEKIAVAPHPKSSWRVEGFVDSVSVHSLA